MSILILNKINSCVKIFSQHYSKLTHSIWNFNFWNLKLGPAQLKDRDHRASPGPDKKYQTRARIAGVQRRAPKICRLPLIDLFALDLFSNIKIQEQKCRQSSNRKGISSTLSFSPLSWIWLQIWLQSIYLACFLQAWPSSSSSILMFICFKSRKHCFLGGILDCSNRSFLVKYAGPFLFIFQALLRWFFGYFISWQTFQR